MARYTRIARVERLIEALRCADHYELQKLEGYEKFGAALDKYVEGEGNPEMVYTWPNLLKAIAALIYEAMEGGDEDGLCFTCCQEQLGESLVDCRSDLTWYLDSQV